MNYAAKFVLYVLTAVLGSTAAGSLIAGDLTSDVLWGTLVTVLGAVAVFIKANTPTQPQAKKVLALVSVVVLAVVDAATDHMITSAEWAQILLALVGAFGTGWVNNVGDDADIKHGLTARSTVG
jgi:uncharacterized membrane protein YdbT with pleckstrin-like domain